METLYRKNKGIIITIEYDGNIEIKMHKSLSDFILFHKNIRYKHAYFFEKYFFKDYKNFKEIRKKELKLSFYDSLFSCNYSFQKIEYDNFNAIKDIYKQCEFFHSINDIIFYDKYDKYGNYVNEINLTKRNFEIIKKHWADYINLLKQDRLNNPIFRIQDNLSNF